MYSMNPFLILKTATRGLKEKVKYQYWLYLGNKITGVFNFSLHHLFFK